MPTRIGFKGDDPSYDPFARLDTNPPIGTGAVYPQQDTGGSTPTIDPGLGIGATGSPTPSIDPFQGIGAPSQQPARGGGGRSTFDTPPSQFAQPPIGSQTPINYLTNPLGTTPAASPVGYSQPPGMGGGETTYPPSAAPSLLSQQASAASPGFGIGGQGAVGEMAAASARGDEDDPWRRRGPGEPTFPPPPPPGTQPIGGKPPAGGGPVGPIRPPQSDQPPSNNPYIWGRQPPPPQGPNGSYTRDQVVQFFSAWQQEQGADKASPEYWADRAMSKPGGLQQGNLQYWHDKMMNPSLGEQGGGGLPPGISTPIGGGDQSRSPLTSMIMDALKKILDAGGSPQSDYGKSIRQSILDTIGRGGRLPNDASAQALEKARSQFQAGSTAMTNQAVAELANRGLLPQSATAGGQGAPGTLLTAQDMISRDLAPQFNASLAGFEQEQQQLANQNYMNALGLGQQGATADQQAYLNAVTEGGNYQKAMGDLALGALNSSIQFQEFLATYGLQRDQVIYELLYGGNQQLANTIIQYLIGGNILGQGALQ